MQEAADWMRNLTISGEEYCAAIMRRVSLFLCRLKSLGPWRKERRGGGSKEEGEEGERRGRRSGRGGGELRKSVDEGRGRKYKHALLTAALAPPTCHIFSNSWSGVLCLRACRIFLICSLR